MTPDGLNNGKAGFPEYHHVYIEAKNVDAYLKTAERIADLGIDQINVGPLPGDPDPVGFVKRLGDDVIPRLAAI